MKIKLFIIAITLFVTSMFCASGHALTKQWSYDLGTNSLTIAFFITQIAADGKGGCAIVWYTSAPGQAIAHVTYFDKKGQKLWEKSYLNRDAIITYCSKKVVVFAVYKGTDNNIVVSVDKKGAVSKAENQHADINGNINTYTSHSNCSIRSSWSYFHLNVKIS